MNKITRACIFFLVVFICSCARKGRPSGGAKDEKAPVMVTANPPYKALNFNKHNIKIYFDEYIILKDLTKQLVVSPPLKNPLLITPQGTPSKSLTIKLLDTLKPNTTYTINFGNAIQDNNEGNKLKSFKYVFSTGATIDSLKIKGTVADAFKKKTAKNNTILLYALDSTFNDSIVYKIKPEYVTSTLDSTSFNFTNIKKGNYFLVVLKEPFNDYLFNPQTDQIGFLKDTLVLPRDSVLTKTVRIFKEQQPFKLKRPKELYKGKIQFGFEGDKNGLNIKLLSPVPNEYTAYSQFEKEKDTLLYWHTPIEADSLRFLVIKKGVMDTVTVRLRKKRTDSLKVISNVKGIFNLKDTLFLETNTPISAIDSTKIVLVDKDTITVAHKLKKVRVNKLAILFEVKSDMSYKLHVLPEAITDLYATKNDTLKYQFRTINAEDYGSIVLDIQNTTNTTVIFELLLGDNVVHKKTITASQKLTFDFLEPNEYIVRAV